MAKTSNKTSAKKQTNTKKKMTKQEEMQLSSLNTEMRGFAFLILGILLTYFILWEQTGTVGTFAAKTMLSLFGKVGKVLLCIALIADGVTILLKKQGVSLWIYILVFVITCAISVNDNIFDLYKFSDTALYSELWNTPSAGGFVCGLCSKFLKESLQVVGTYILLIGIIIISFIVIYKKSFVSAVKHSADVAKETAEEIKNKLPSKTLDFEDDSTSSIMRKKQKEKTPSIELKKTKTVLETKNGDRLILVKKSDIPKENKFLDDFETHEPSPRKATSKNKTAKNTEPHSFLDDFDDSMPNRENKKVSKKNFAVNNVEQDTVSNTDITQEEEKITAKDMHEATYAVKEKINESKSTAEESEYQFPPVSLLDPPERGKVSVDATKLRQTGAKLLKVLADFGVEANIENITTGPVLTRYEVSLKSGTRVSKVSGLANDIAYALAAKSIRIEAPIPGKSAIGIEIPNDTRRIVRLSEILTDKQFKESKSPLTIALGQTITGQTLLMDIPKMVHVLIAGATGAGKSVCMNTLILSILYHAKPEDVRLILIDPKKVEFSSYANLPHLLIPVVTNPKEAAGALGWAVREMEDRYEKFSESKVKNLKGYNEYAKANDMEKLPYIVLIIDELSDLMMVAGKQIEDAIVRLAQLARAAGIHLVLATQRPTVNVITGTIKANIPGRIAFATNSQIDARTILDVSGAEKLLRNGDMLFKETDEIIRAQGAFVSDEEVERVVDFIKEHSSANFNDEIHEEIINSANKDDDVKSVIENAHEDENDDEALIKKAMEIAYQNKGKLSTSLLQRRLRVGYARGARIVDEMENRGYISPADGSKPREVLISYEEFFNEEEE